MESSVDAAVLQVALWLPLIGAIFLLLFADERGPNHARVWAAWLSGVTLLLSVYLYWRYMQLASGDMHFVTRVNWLQGTTFNFGASYALGLDGISMPLFL